MSITDIHVTYGLIPQIGKTSVADDAAQTEPGDHRRPFGGHGPSRGHHARWILASARRATRRTLANQPVVNDDDSVIAGWCEHAAMYPHRIAIARMITRRTQHHPLSATSDHPSNGYAMRVHGSMLLVTAARKPVARLPRGECSDQH